MKSYSIKCDGFTIGQAEGKKRAVDMLGQELAWRGIASAEWGKFKAGVLKVRSSHHEFTIEEAV